MSAETCVCRPYSWISERTKGPVLSRRVRREPASPPPDEDFATHQAADVVQIARLLRGEYGIFVTTSYYTRQAQDEVLEDAYPVKIFSGAGLVRFFRELRLVAGDHLRGVGWPRPCTDSPDGDVNRASDIAEPNEIADIEKPLSGVRRANSSNRAGPGKRLVRL